MHILAYHVENESESLSVMCDSLRPHGLYSPWNSPGQNTGVDSLSLLQGILPTQEDMTEHTPKEETGTEASVL